MAKQDSTALTKRVDQLLEKPRHELNKKELAIVEMYETEVTKQEADEASHVPQAGRIELISQYQKFQMPDEATAGEIAVVILGSVITRGFWAWDEDKDGNKPGLCFSIGGVVGKPTDAGAEFSEGAVSPGAEPMCTRCPFDIINGKSANEFGSAKAGQEKGKACKEMRKLLVVVPGYKAPMTLSVPPSSIRAYDKYRSDAVTCGVPLSAHFTKIGLERQQKSDRVWSTFKFARGEFLGIDDMRLFVEAGQRFAETINKVEDSDYREDVTLNGEPVTAATGTDGAPTNKDQDDLPF